MKNQKFLLTLWGFVLGVGAFYVSAGCDPNEYANLPQRRPALPVTHTYTLSIVDVNGLPAESVSVHYSVFDLHRLVQDTTVMTNSDGLVSMSFRATAAPGDEYPRSYRSEFHYRVSTDGYYEKSGMLNAEYGEDYSLEKPIVSETVELVKPTDYFDPAFLVSEEGIALKANILNIIDTLRLSVRSDTYMEVHAIQIVSFKEKKYLTLKFIDTNTYNSLKLSKYDIAKTLFDEVIKRALTALHEQLRDSEAFYGYDLSIVGEAKSFADTYAAGTNVFYRFLIPGEIVLKYKNKDISGQQVLDQSIILMDDERIELKLQ